MSKQQAHFSNFPRVPNIEFPEKPNLKRRHDSERSETDNGVNELKGGQEIIGFSVASTSATCVTDDSVQRYSEDDIKRLAGTYANLQNDKQQLRNTIEQFPTKSESRDDLIELVGRLQFVNTAMRDLENKIPNEMKPIFDIEIVRLILPKEDYGFATNNTGDHVIRTDKSIEPNAKADSNFDDDVGILPDRSLVNQTQRPDNALQAPHILQSTSVLPEIDGLPMDRQNNMPSSSRSHSGQEGGSVEDSDILSPEEMNVLIVLPTSDPVTSELAITETQNTFLKNVFESVRGSKRENCSNSQQAFANWKNRIKNKCRELANFFVARIMRTKATKKTFKNTDECDLIYLATHIEGNNQSPSAKDKLFAMAESFAEWENFKELASSDKMFNLIARPPTDKKTEDLQTFIFGDWGKETQTDDSGQQAKPRKQVNRKGKTSC